jgi:PAS domain S-box-containing protein
MSNRLHPSTPSAELRAIKWFTLTHALGVVAFIALMALFFWYLRFLEQGSQQQSMYQDIEWAQQSMRLKWREIQDEVALRANDWSGVASPQAERTGAAIQQFLERNPEVAYLAFVDPHRIVRWSIPGRGTNRVVHRTAGDEVDDSSGYAALHGAQAEQRQMFSAPMLADANEIAFEMHTPVQLSGEYFGTLVTGLSFNRSLVYGLPRKVRERYQVSIVDEGGNILVSSTPRHIHDANLSYELPLDPPGHGVRLRAYAFETRQALIERTLMAAVIGLSLLSVLSLVLLWRHARRRVAAEVERDRLFTLSLDLMAVMRLDGTFIRVNPAFEATLGQSAASSRLIDLVHPLDRTQVAAALARLAASGGAATTEFEARFGADRHARWLQWSIRGDPDRSVRALYAVAHDTTERKSAETALAAETAFRRAMEDSILTGMRAFDMEGRITYVNRAFCQMVGFDESELVGKGAPYPYWPEGTLRENEENLHAALSGEAPASGFKVKVRRKDGSLFDARMYVSALIDTSGRQTGWMTSVTDITEPNRIREELAAAHERFTTVLDELDAAVSVAAPCEEAGPGERTPGRELLFANRSYRQVFGSAATGHFALLARVPPSAEAAPVEVFAEDVGRWFELRSRQIRWVDGSTVRMLVATDVNRRRDAEDQHRQQGEKLQRTSRLVTMGEMASSLAHELNQPLTAIANYCMGLSARVRAKLAAGQAPDSTELLEMLGKTAAQAERAGKVIRRIRDFVKRSEPERRICDVRMIVADAVGLAEIDAQRLRVRLQVTLSPDLPELNADPILIEQVLLNLLKNGVEAMRASSRRDLTLRVFRRGDAVEFMVADSGSGMSEEVRDRLFEPFYTTKAEGMGMGLNICRSIVESHQGRLWVEDNPGGGCVFHFTLPLTGEDRLAQAA